MHLLFYWKRENYDADTQRKESITAFEQNSLTMLKAESGDRVWAFTRRKNGSYALAGKLTVADTDAKGQHYGDYRAIAANDGTRLFPLDDDIERTDFEELVRHELSLKADADVLGRSFRGPNAVRQLSAEDDRRLEEFAEGRFGSSGENG